MLSFRRRQCGTRVSARREQPCLIACARRVLEESGPGAANVGGVGSGRAPRLDADRCGERGLGQSFQARRRQLGLSGRCATRADVQECGDPERAQLWRKRDCNQGLRTKSASSGKARAAGARQQHIQDIRLHSLLPRPLPCPLRPLFACSPIPSRHTHILSSVTSRRSLPARGGPPPSTLSQL